MGQMKNEGWSVVRVLCTDGVERIGMCYDWEASPERIVQHPTEQTTGLHPEYANAILNMIAREYNTTVFDGRYDTATFNY